MENPKKYKLGIALSGGGARGFAHLGALKALEEAGIVPDIIAGVSAGSAVGALYAAKVPIDEVMKLFGSVKFTDLCSLSIMHRKGFFSIVKFSKLIEKTAGYKRLEQLPIPLYVGVTDLNRGEATEFHDGPLAPRIAASCSVPIVFSPVKINNSYYIDGGVLRNLPAWTIRDKCEKLIGINCSPLTTYRYSNKNNSILDVATRTYMLLARYNAEPDIAMCDQVISTPDLAQYQLFNLKDIQKVYRSGYAAAHRALRDWNL